MVDIKTFKQLALSFAGVEEQPHFEKSSFRVKKKIFATHAPDSNVICVKLTEIDQSVFCAFDKTIIYPVNNKWGKQGWTLVDLQQVRKDMLKDILTTAYTGVSSPKKK
ncbi:MULTISPECIES: MmcQ/YjbR family DNA-binding protein [Niastella]|uniref:MmcQ/YjbR family DNA-binding protein n=1 Tax=Niastella soli TaxID=2821487 RepID=A0ABS3Z066_9BACT|nr:MmcQ/YjbR family DNA-binding protein [Niastella soli]MBO9203566.1 MmcQ/YjbR family DNA-binding protein [Niastella soli]